VLAETAWEMVEALRALQDILRPVVVGKGTPRLRKL